jgi:hypothetical protein
MTVLTEMIRQLSKEKNLITDATDYNTLSTTWATMHNYGNITLTEDSFIIFYYIASQANGGGNTGCNQRLKIGNYYVAGFPLGGYGSNTPPTACWGFAWLPAGTYAVIMEGIAQYLDGSNYCIPHVSNFQLGLCAFPDELGTYLNAYSSLITQTMPTVRVTAVGPLANAVLHVEVFANTSGAQTNFEDVGETKTNGVSISIDGTQVNWTEKHHDNIGPGSWSPFWGAAFARLCKPVSLGVSHTVSLSFRNASTVAHLSVYVCPWVLGTADCAPVNLNFSPGSTIYVTLEPLQTDCTKSVKVGKPRAIDLGSSTDYYFTLSGSAIQSFSQVLDVYDVPSLILYVSGYPACISIIGADVR